MNRLVVGRPVGVNLGGDGARRPSDAHHDSDQRLLISIAAAADADDGQCLRNVTAGADHWCGDATDLWSSGILAAIHRVADCPNLIELRLQGTDLEGVANGLEARPEAIFRSPGEENPSRRGLRWWGNESLISSRDASRTGPLNSTRENDVISQPLTKHGSLTRRIT